MNAGALTATTFYWLNLFGRLDKGSAEQVSSEATGILQSSSTAGNLEGTWRVVADPLGSLRNADQSSDARLLAWLSAAASLLFFIACVNNASLMLVRFLGRSSELATRAALGAKRSDLLRLAVLDAALVASCAGVIAAALVYGTSAVMRTWLFPRLGLPGGHLDLRAAILISVLTFIGGVLSGMPTVILVASSRCSWTPEGQSGFRTRFSERAGATVVIAQCAISVLLLVGAGLVSRSLKNVTDLDLGFDTERVLYARAALPASLSRADALALYDMFAERVATVPGVRGVAVAMGLPLSVNWGVSVTLPAGVWSGPVPVALGRAVGPNYFEVTGLRILRGRAFTLSDHTPPARVAIINQAFARRFWPDGDPVGSCLRLGDDDYCTNVTGVAANTPLWNITAESDYEVYIPMTHISDWGEQRTLALAIRASDDPSRLSSPIRTAIESTETGILYATVTPVETIVAPQVRPWRIATALFGGFGLVACILTAVGIYGLLAFLVRARTKEIGIRIALGASGWVIWRTSVAHGALLCMLGAAAGLAMAGFLAPLGESFLFGVTAREPIVYVSAAVLVFLVAVTASSVPVRHALRWEAGALIRVED